MNLRRVPLAVMIVFVAAVAALAVAGASARQGPVPGGDPSVTIDAIVRTPDIAGTLQRQLLAKAAPDECYDGVGNPYPPGPPCATGQPKVNQAYVWGLAQAGSALWFGTAPNVHCLVIGGYLGQTQSIETDSYVCELGDGQYTEPPYNLPAAIGDWRPPHIYVYNQSGSTLTEKSPVADPRFRTTLGIRAAGTLNDVVLLGGPGFGGSVNLFAFQASTGNYLGSASLAGRTNIRKFLVAGNVLYTGVGNSNGTGSVLRWKGSVASPFLFDEVGTLDADAAELALHEGRIFVSTWPGSLSGGGTALAGLWMSPTLGSSGLATGSASQWSKVWSVDKYEPDPVTAMAYGGGALVSFGGYLYWGTMHVPTLAAAVHDAVYGPAYTLGQQMARYAGTHRAISIFRGKNIGVARRQVMEVVYGESQLPVYNASRGGGWSNQPTKMGAPRFGPSGFGNTYNNYTWTMAVFNGQLYVGTMDWSYLAQDMGQLVAMVLPAPDPANYGADLWRIPSASLPAVAESIAGVGNNSSYGIRTMIGSDALYLGMANPMNLLTDPTDALPEGGWELLKLTPAP